MRSVYVVARPNNVRTPIATVAVAVVRAVVPCAISRPLTIRRFHHPLKFTLIRSFVPLPFVCDATYSE